MTLAHKSISTAGNRREVGGGTSFNFIWNNYIDHTVERENLAHTYFSANASASTLAQLYFSARTFSLKKNTKNVLV